MTESVRVGIKRRFRAVPGVIDVTGWGGKTRQYEVEIDLNKLVASKLTLPQVIQTLSTSNINVGGNTIDIGPQSAVVRRGADARVECLVEGRLFEFLARGPALPNGVAPGLAVRIKPLRPQVYPKA